MMPRIGKRNERKIIEFTKKFCAIFVFSTKNEFKRQIDRHKRFI
jgi:hypothetical protein